MEEEWIERGVECRDSVRGQGMAEMYVDIYMRVLE